MTTPSPVRRPFALLCLGQASVWSTLFLGVFLGPFAAHDPFYGPSMEKVVGISGKYRVNHAGHTWDIGRRYSTSVRFVYEGP